MLLKRIRKFPTVWYINFKPIHPNLNQRICNYTYYISHFVRVTIWSYVVQ
jgi:hypothetical protein